MAGRAWTGAERAALQAEYGSTPTAELAARLGRTERAVKFEACRAGAAKKQRGRDPAFGARCAALRAAGLPNEGIARQLGVSRNAVTRALSRLGLEPLGHSAPAYRQQARDRARDRADRGLPNPTHCRRDRQRATTYGLPPLGPVALRVLLELTTGPKTRRQLAEAVGQSWTQSRRSLKTSGGSSIPAELIRRGLVTLTRKAVGHHGLYALTPLALDLLAQGAAK